MTDQYALRASIIVLINTRFYMNKSKLTHTFGKSKRSLPSISFTVAVKVERVMVHSEISFIIKLKETKTVHRILARLTLMRGGLFGGLLLPRAQG